MAGAATGGASPAGANLSASDFFGIPLQLQTTGGGQPKTLTWNYNDAVNTAAVFQALGALENFQTDTSPTPSAPSSRAARTASRSTRLTDP